MLRIAPEKPEFLFWNTAAIFAILKTGGLAQLARALAWHARGHRFDSGNLHKEAVLKVKYCREGDKSGRK